MIFVVLEAISAIPLLLLFPCVTSHDSTHSGGGVEFPASSSLSVMAFAIFAGIFLRIDSTPMVFVSAHFAAHQGKVEIRNKDYSEILEGLQFNRPVLDIMSECHRSFWCGDLNYRIDAPM